MGSLKLYEVTQPSGLKSDLWLSDADAAAYGEKARLVDQPRKVTSAQPEQPVLDEKSRTVLNKARVGQDKGFGPDGK